MSIGAKKVSKRFELVNTAQNSQHIGLISRSNNAALTIGDDS